MDEATSTINDQTPFLLEDEYIFVHVAEKMIESIGLTTHCKERAARTDSHVALTSSIS
jgi:hypothetical protein